MNSVLDGRFSAHALRFGLDVARARFPEAFLTCVAAVVLFALAPVAYSQNAGDGQLTALENLKKDHEEEIKALDQRVADSQDLEDFAELSEQRDQLLQLEIPENEERIRELNGELNTLVIDEGSARTFLKGESLTALEKKRDDLKRERRTLEQRRASIQSKLDKLEGEKTTAAKTDSLVRELQTALEETGKQQESNKAQEYATKELLAILDDWTTLVSLRQKLESAGGDISEDKKLELREREASMRQRIEDGQKKYPNDIVFTFDEIRANLPKEKDVERALKQIGQSVEQLEQTSKNLANQMVFTNDRLKSHLEQISKETRRRIWEAQGELETVGARLDSLSSEKEKNDTQIERATQAVEEAGNKLRTVTKEKERIKANIAHQKEIGGKLLALRKMIEGTLTRQLIPQTAANEFKLLISFSFTALVALVIIGFFIMAGVDKDVRRTIFSSQSGIQFLTLFSLVIAIILFGITGILEGKELSALLGGISGYILGRVTTGSTKEETETSSAPAKTAG